MRLSNIRFLEVTDPIVLDMKNFERFVPCKNFMKYFKSNKRLNNVEGLSRQTNKNIQVDLSIMRICDPCVRPNFLAYFDEGYLLSNF
jgi:hypothetical protein